MYNKLMYNKFIEKIETEYETFKEKELQKTPEEIFNNYYKIHEMSEISSYLLQSQELPEEWIEELLEIPNLLEALYGFELGYDIEGMIEEFLSSRN